MVRILLKMNFESRDMLRPIAAAILPLSCLCASAGPIGAEPKDHPSAYSLAVQYVDGEYVIAQSNNRTIPDYIEPGTLLGTNSVLIESTLLLEDPNVKMLQHILTSTPRKEADPAAGPAASDLASPETCVARSTEGRLDICIKESPGSLDAEQEDALKQFSREPGSYVVQLRKSENTSIQNAAKTAAAIITNEMNDVSVSHLPPENPSGDVVITYRPYK